jgi:hypothetical protein
MSISEVNMRVQIHLYTVHRYLIFDRLPPVYVIAKEAPPFRFHICELWGAHSMRTGNL